MASVHGGKRLRMAERRRFADMPDVLLTGVFRSVSQSDWCELRNMSRHFRRVADRCDGLPTTIVLHANTLPADIQTGIPECLLRAQDTNVSIFTAVTSILRSEVATPL